MLGTRKLTYQGTEIDLDGRWERIRVEDAIVKYSEFKDKAKLRDRAALLGLRQAQGPSTWIPRIRSAGS